jgi:hypothetical protein
MFGYKVCSNAMNGGDHQRAPSLPGATLCKGLITILLGCHLLVMGRDSMCMKDGDAGNGER